MALATALQRQVDGLGGWDMSSVPLPLMGLLICFNLYIFIFCNYDRARPLTGLYEVLWKWFQIVLHFALLCLLDGLAVSGSRTRSRS